MASDEPCLIASKSAVRGQISGKQDLIVRGPRGGPYRPGEPLTIEESGSVEADMEVSQVTVKGEARGTGGDAFGRLARHSTRGGKISRAPDRHRRRRKFSGTIEMEVELPADIKAGGPSPWAARSGWDKNHGKGKGHKAHGEHGHRKQHRHRRRGSQRGAAYHPGNG